MIRLASAVWITLAQPCITNGPLMSVREVFGIGLCQKCIKTTSWALSLIPQLLFLCPSFEYYQQERLWALLMAQTV